MQKQKKKQNSIHSIYEPREDSFLLAEHVKKIAKKGMKVLDIGTGSGIQAEACIEAGIKKSNIIVSDIDNCVIKLMRKKSFQAIKSDLFSNLKGRLNVKGNLVPLLFDLIIFNPPYLPEHKFDKQPDTTGGKKGDETIVRFLKQASAHLKENGKILIVFSSLTPTKRINNEIKKQKLKKKILDKKRIFFEELEVWLLTVS